MSTAFSGIATGAFAAAAYFANAQDYHAAAVSGFIGMAGLTAFLQWRAK